MSNEEDERFARDLEKALELSRITERQDNDRRKKYGVIFYTVWIGFLFSS